MHTRRSEPHAPRQGLWTRARSLAEQTPAERNRYVDFLRAVAIAAVVFGHWLVAAPWVAGGDLVGENLLGVAPWTQWLTWGFQVMPVFFLVGGFSNGVSWSSTLARGGRYSGWFAGRLQRLVNPVMPLFLAWMAFLFGARTLGVDPAVAHVASALALVPVWFLAVYILVVAAVPLTWAAWQRWGMGSFWALAAAVALVDVLNLGLGVPFVKYANFAFVWLGVHQLGYAWQQGRFADARRAFAWGLSGLAATAALVAFGPYPVSMIGAPGDAITNSMPPKLALFTLGIFQAGLVLALERPARRLLENLRLWTSVILVNGMIMTVYLWHLTAFILVVSAAAGSGLGLEAVPGSSAWWATRPLWLALYAATTLPFIAIFARFENGSFPVAERVSGWRLVVGGALVCGGLSATAAGGLGTEDWMGFEVWVAALPLLGAALVDLGPLAHRRRGRGNDADSRPRTADPA